MSFVCFSHAAVGSALIALVIHSANSSPLQSPATPDRATPSATFDSLRQHADEARTGGRFEEAIELYSRAVRLRPAWIEGHWYLGTTYYEIEKYPDCRDAFRTVVRLQHTNGAARAFKGLCEFRLNNYSVALSDLNKA